MTALGPGSRSYRNSAVERGPGKLWSLWDMLELRAGAFVEAATAIANTVSYISGKSAAKPGEPSTFHEDKKLEGPDVTYVHLRLNTLLEHLDVLGADVTNVAVDDARKLVKSFWATWGTARGALQEVETTLRRELSLKAVLVLQTEELLYYAPKKPLFGADFEDKFKTEGAFELDEAAKCLALSRPTASVFHLMRILEIGIAALAGCLDIPDPVKPAERNWGVMLRKIKEEGIEKKWPTGADRMAGDGLLFEGMHASLDAVKNPWRNEIMHVAGKYTEDEAKHIFVAVGGFMKKLSARMDEKGLPKA